MGARFRRIQKRCSTAPRSAHWEGRRLIAPLIPSGTSTAGYLHCRGSARRADDDPQEGIWLDKPDVLRVETTITDPGVRDRGGTSSSWPTRRTLRLWEIRRNACEENNRPSADEGGANIDLEPSTTPTIPFGLPPEE